MKNNKATYTVTEIDTVCGQAWYRLALLKGGRTLQGWTGYKHEIDALIAAHGLEVAA